MVLLARQRTVQRLFTRLSLSMALLSRRLQLGCVVQKDGLTHINSSSRNRFQFVRVPLPLAATKGISIDFFSYGY